MADHERVLDQALKNTVAVILAGGRGSRLLDLGTHQAKPAVPFGGTHRLIDFPLSNCINSGIRRIGVATQFKSQSLMHHINRGWGFLHRDLNEFIDLWPAHQDSSGNGWYTGTADAVFRNLEHLSIQSPEHVLILAGDHVYKQDYRCMLADHLARDADVTVSCVEVPAEQAHDFGIVTTNAAGAITAFVEKPDVLPVAPDPQGACFASMGIYLFKAAFIAELLYEDHYCSASRHDFGHDLLPGLVGRANIFAHRFSKSCRAGVGSPAPYWHDVGTLDAYWSANLDLTVSQPPLELYDTSWPIRTALAQLPAARIVQSVGEQNGFVRNVILSPGVVLHDACVVDSVLSNGVQVASHCRVEQSVLLPNVTIGKGSRLRKSIVADGCQIPEEFTVGQDPAEDARWFTRTPEGVTLVTPQGLRQRAIGLKLSLVHTPLAVHATSRHPETDYPPRQEVAARYSRTKVDQKSLEAQS